MITKQHLGEWIIKRYEQEMARRELKDEYAYVPEFTEFMEKRLRGEHLGKPLPM